MACKNTNFLFKIRLNKSCWSWSVQIKIWEWFRKGGSPLIIIWVVTMSVKDVLLFKLVEFVLLIRISINITWKYEIINELLIKNSFNQTFSDFYYTSMQKLCKFEGRNQYRDWWVMFETRIFPKTSKFIKFVLKIFFIRGKSSFTDYDIIRLLKVIQFCWQMLQHFQG